MARVVLAITGASGTRYGRRLLQVLSSLPVTVDLVVSAGARLVLSSEEGIDPGSPADPGRLVADLGGLGEGAITVHDPADVSSPIASGSPLVDAMVILPCSMATLGAVASGAGHNLVHRAADVTMKEGRPLLVCPREAPLSPIHLRNMLRLSEAGVCVLPCAPPFSHRPTTLDGLVDGLVMRVCDRLGFRTELVPRWDG